MNSVKKTNAATQKVIDKAAELILDCDSIFFISGAGLGVSSGFGTYRGTAAHVWSPLLQEPKLNYVDIVNPNWFRKPQGNSTKRDTVNFCYAFWSDRYKSYTSAAPHFGYSICKKLSELSHVKSAFSFTSNVDGHWIKSGWKESSLLECHGSIHYMQCINNCSKRVWPTNDQLNLTIDSRTNCVTDSLPLCPDCKELARPNIVMFDDWEFAGTRYDEHFTRYGQFLSAIAAAKAKLLVIELGVGTVVPSGRLESESVFTDKRWISHLIRINPSADDSMIDQSWKNKSRGEALELPLDALSALTIIDEKVRRRLKA